MHGGDSGEVQLPSADQTNYVFDLTLEQARRSESRYVLPTLREVFELTAKRTFLNIEMKTPWEEIPRARYQMAAAAKAVH